MWGLSKGLFKLSVLKNIWLFSPFVFLVCGRPISSESSGLWQGSLVMATHSCNMDCAFHISVVNKGNGRRSFSITTSHDLPRSWQRRTEAARERERYTDHVFKWLRLNSVTVNVSRALGRAAAPCFYTQMVKEKTKGIVWKERETDSHSK